MRLAAVIRSSLRIATKMKGLREVLKDGGSVVVAEGYLWEFERRGFVQFGALVPEVVLSKPDEVELLHEEFALAGSDVIEAFTYFGHRDQLKRHGMEHELERLNRNALKIAKRVADKYEKLMAAGLSQTQLFNKSEPSTHQQVYDIFKEQLQWYVEEGADYIIGETFDFYGEAELALKAIKEHGNGLPAVITMSAHIPDHTMDYVDMPEACKRLEDQGAAVVGLNCSRGPNSMLPLIKEIRKVCKGPVACLPVPYRTTDKERSFYSIKDPLTGDAPYPMNLDSLRHSRTEIRSFAEEAKAAGVQYIGLCCGNYPSLLREVAEVYGKNPAASKYSAKPSWLTGEKPTTDFGKLFYKFVTGEEI